MSNGNTYLPERPQPDGKGSIFKPDHGYLALAGLIFIFIASTIHVVANSERHVLDQGARNAALEHATDAAARLEAEINSNIFLANGLATYVSGQEAPDPEDLESALRTLTGLGKHIRNIGIAQGYRLTYIYPMKGNEDAIGLYYPDVPEQWTDVKKAIDSKSTVVAGPLQLAQGGLGVISRTPVFTEDGKYWGILSLVLDADSLFHGAGLADRAEGHRIALRSAMEGTQPKTAFFGDNAVFANDPVTTEILLPGNKWELGLVPAGGWTADHQLINLIESVFIAIASGFSVFLFIFFKNRDRLRVREREITAILNTSREGIVVLDAEDNVLEANAAACVMFARDVSMILGKPASEIIDFNSGDGDEMCEFKSVYGKSSEEDTLRATGLCARRGKFPLEIKVGQTQSTGRYLMVCALRDISADLIYERKLIELATIDPLTRASNRRSFFAQAEKAVKLAKRHDRDVSLLLLDADHFKAINDTYGHVAGDDVLKALGSLVFDNIRGTDIFGRIGGEEFAILLPETSAEDANILATKIIGAVENTQVRRTSGEAISLTVSIGVASSSDHGYNFHDMLVAADQALYRAKRGGRNRYAV